MYFIEKGIVCVVLARAANDVIELGKLKQASGTTHACTSFVIAIAVGMSVCLSVGLFSYTACLHAMLYLCHEFFLSLSTENVEF